MWAKQQSLNSYCFVLGFFVESLWFWPSPKLNQVKQTDSRLKIYKLYLSPPLTGCAVKCEIQVRCGVPFWQFNQTSKTSRAFGHRCISMCSMTSPMCEKHEQQSKHCSCISHYKSQTSLTTPPSPPQSLHPWLQDCVELFKWDSSWVNGWLRSKQTGFLAGERELWEDGYWARVPPPHPHPIHDHLHGLSSCPLTQVWQKCMCDSFRL